MLERLQHQVLEVLVALRILMQPAPLEPQAEARRLVAVERLELPCTVVDVVGLVMELKVAAAAEPLDTQVEVVMAEGQMRLVLVALAVLVVAVVEALYLVSLARGAAEALVVAV